MRRIVNTHAEYFVLLKHVRETVAASEGTDGRDQNMHDMQQRAVVSYM